MLFELDSLRLEAERIANPSSSSFSSSVRPPSPEASPLAERRMEALWSTLERSVSDDLRQRSNRVCGDGRRGDA